MATIDQVRKVVPCDGALVLTANEREAILEIAYLAIWADHTLRDEELRAFRAVASRLRYIEGDPDDPRRAPPKPEETMVLVSDRELNAILDRFGQGLDRAQADERLRVLATSLTRSAARGLAYKLAYALSLCDLHTSDEEFEFDLQLIDSLKLTNEEAEGLAAEVHEIFGSNEG